MESTEEIDLSPLTKLFEKYGLNDALDTAESIVESPNASILNEAFEKMQNMLTGSIKDAAKHAAASMPALILLLILRAVLKDGESVCTAAFMLRLYLIHGLCACVVGVIASIESCLTAACDTAQAATPVMVTLLTTAGIPSAAQLLTPSSAIMVSIITKLFSQYGIPLCRFALCCAVAGNLSSAIDLGSVYILVRKLINWGSGLLITIFTGLLSLQSTIASGADRISVKTAKYAVDSAGSLIGSGIIDAWDTYISGLTAVRSTVGISGIFLIIAANLAPMIAAAACMAILKLLSAACDIFGEKQTGRLIGQLSGVCQISLSLMAAASCSVTILIMAAMAAGGGLFQ